VPPLVLLRQLGDVPRQGEQLSIMRIMTTSTNRIALDDGADSHTQQAVGARRIRFPCYDVAAARARGRSGCPSVAPCWISRTRNASTMSLTPRISANAATHATSRTALRP
jgi:hypothetical protein